MAELLPTLVGSSLCTIAIFVPFLFLGGVTGAFFRVLALSMALMLASSFLLCVDRDPAAQPDGARTAAERGRPPAVGSTAVLRFATAHRLGRRRPARGGADRARGPARSARSAAASCPRWTRAR